MLSGYRNLGYLTFGERSYGIQPILSKVRHYWEFEFILTGFARPSGVTTPEINEDRPRLYVSHPQSPHGWTDPTAGISEVFVLHFQEVPAELIERVEPTKPLLIYLDDDSLEQLSPRFNTIRAGAGKSDTLTSLNLLSFLIELTTLAIRQTPNTTLRTDPADKVNRTLHWFEENIGRSPSVADAARAVGVSTAHLRRLFAQAGAPAPKSELARLQIEAAQRALVEGWSQKEIAEFLGFSEPSTFARSFKEICGKPPGLWLKDNMVQ